jgi:hypothetical protein
MQTLLHTNSWKVIRREERPIISQTQEVEPQIRLQRNKTLTSLAISSNNLKAFSVALL